MRFQIIILICVIGVNSSYKDIISISIDNDKPDRNKERSREKNIQIEISKANNQSHENINIDGGYEFYNIGSREHESRKSHQDYNHKAHEEDSWHGGRILSSIEETTNLWEETHRDKIYREKMRSEPASDHIFHESVSSFENTNNIPSVYAKELSRKNNQIESRKSIKNQAHHSKVENRIKESNGDIIRRKTISEKAKENRDVPISSENEHGQERATQFNADADISRVPCNFEAGNLEYQANTKREDSDEQGSLADYSYSVSVQRKGSHYASGALVGARWVLSTAAEFYNVRETIKLYRMRLGSADCKKGGYITAIQSITVHPRFTPGNPGFDISILTAAGPVQTSYEVKPIALTKVSARKVVNAMFLTTYWPRIVVKDMVLPPTAAERVKYSSMRVSTQKLVPAEKCRKLLAAVNASLDTNSLCLKPVKAHHSDCMPDAGAPVVSADGLWGITSGWVSPGCPTPSLPTVITRLATLELRAWLNDHIHL